MTSADATIRSQTPEAGAALRGLDPARLQWRVLRRRRNLTMQMLSYGLGAMILGFYAHSGAIPIYIPFAYLLSGIAVCGSFLVLSEIGFNDRFSDHYLVVAQVAAQVSVQYAFLVLLPQIAYAFLGVIFLIFSTGALSMTSRRATVTWLLMTLGAIPIFLTMNLPLGMAMDSPFERMAALLCFIATIGQCVFVGLYGSSLRKQLYRNGIELRLAYSRIEELAELDELTGALNRRCIMQILDDEISYAQRDRTPCSVALIDLDWFKRVNDLFGHPTGDEVLRTFAITVFANIRAPDKFGRYGGEEFLLVLPNTSSDAAVRLLDRLRMNIAELDWTALSPGMNVTISAGVVTLVDDETADAVLARVDRALYAAKRGGRNRIECRG